MTARHAGPEFGADILRAGIDEQNPWPGLGSFDEAAQRFFNGRRQEAAELRRLILSAPLAVVFGASGLGKTSLLQAGLFPLARHENLLPVYVRIDVRDRTASLIDQARAAMVAQFHAHQVDAPAFRAGESLWEWLHRDNLELWSGRNQLLTPLLVLDQFEEVFTLGLENPEAIQRLRVDLADLIENRIPARVACKISAAEEMDSGLSPGSQRYKVLISFREDFLPAVEGWKRDLPSVMRNRLRLLPMSTGQAFDAVHNTAPHLADDAIAREIVRFAAAAQEQGASATGSGEEASGDPAVEPALLSLVCHGLNERRKAQGKPAFDLVLLRGTGQTIISDYYREAVGDLPDRVRHFIEEELITERGFRKPCDMDDALAIHGIEPLQLRLLVDRRLLRLEPHRGTERIELTHDLLTRVVREHRDRQREKQRSRKQTKRRIVLIAIGAGLIALAAVLFQMYRSQKAAAQSAKQEANRANEQEAIARKNAHEAARNKAVADQKAIEADAERARAQAALVRSDVEKASYIREGRSDQALAHLARALRLSPDFVPARSWLTNLLLRRSWWVPTVDSLRHNDVVRFAALNRDGTLVVTASPDGVARVWDATAGRLLAEIRHGSPLRSVDFSPEGERVVTAGDDGFARIWNWASGKMIGQPMQYVMLTSAQFSTDGTRVVIASETGKEASHQDGSVWDAATGKQIAGPQQLQYGLLQGVSTFLTEICEAFSPDGRYAVGFRALRPYSKGSFFDADTGRPEGKLMHTEEGTHTYFVTFSGDSKRVASVTQGNAVPDCFVHVWSVPTGEAVGPPVRYTNRIRTAVLNSDGSRLLTVSVDNTVQTWDPKYGLPISRPIPHNEPVNSIAFSPDGTLFLTTNDDGTLRIFDSVSGNPASEPIRHEAAVRYGSFSRSGRKILTASDDRTARIWQLKTARPAELSSESLKQTAREEVSPGGSRELKVNDKIIEVRDLRASITGNLVLKHPGTVSLYVFSRDGSLLLTVSNDNPEPINLPVSQSVRVWELAHGALIGKPLRHPQPVTSAAFSPDGSRVLTASTGVARLWEVSTGKALGERMKHGAPVIASAFTADAGRLVTVSPGSVRVWNALSGEPLSDHIYLGVAIQDAAFTPDGNGLIVAPERAPPRFFRLLLGSPTNAGLLADFAEALCGCRIESNAIVPVDDQMDRLRKVRQSAAKGTRSGGIESFLRDFFE